MHVGRCQRERLSTMTTLMRSLYFTLSFRYFLGRHTKHSLPKGAFLDVPDQLGRQHFRLSISTVHFETYDLCGVGSANMNNAMKPRGLENTWH